MGIEHNEVGQQASANEDAIGRGLPNDAEAGIVVEERLDPGSGNVIRIEENNGERLRGAGIVLASAIWSSRPSWSYRFGSGARARLLFHISVLYANHDKCLTEARSPAHSFTFPHACPGF
jgi:hypothetical protein